MSFSKFNLKTDNMNGNTLTHKDRYSSGALDIVR